jgi:hypothetical protein
MALIDIDVRSGTDTTQIYGGTAGAGEVGQERGQSFIPKYSGSIYSVHLRLFKGGNPLDNTIIKITASLGGAAVATKTIASTGVSDTSTEYVFDAPGAIEANKTYYIELSRSGARDTGNYVGVRMNYTTDPYPYKGALLIKSNTTWSVDSATSDFHFATWMLVYQNKVNILAIGGGGEGSSSTSGGSGGAGGHLRFLSGRAVATGEAYTVTVGAGGSGGGGTGASGGYSDVTISASSILRAAGGGGGTVSGSGAANGVSTTITGTVTGGNGGTVADPGNTASAGGGGGAGGYNGDGGVGGIGNATGGTAATGSGAAGGGGGAPSTGIGGGGGGTGIFYLGATGAGGAAGNPATRGAAGSAGTGGGANKVGGLYGGGGGGSDTSTATDSGDGGAGIVVFSYPTGCGIVTTGYGSQDTATVAGMTFDIFTASGTYTITRAAPVKLVNGLELAYVKTKNGLAKASIKSWNGL